MKNVMELIFICFSKITIRAHLDFISTFAYCMVSYVFLSPPLEVAFSHATSVNGFVHGQVMIATCGYTLTDGN